MTTHLRCKTKAFGVEEGEPPYRLRQARYYEIAMDCATWADQHQANTGRKLDLLDIGTFDGVIRKYTEIFPGGRNINFHAVDIFPYGREFVYKYDSWQLHHVNLEQGLPGLETDSYDVVVCEQVLEHLYDPGVALAECCRVLRPNGRIVLGVPIFPFGLHLIRKHVVPATDRLFRVTKIRSHVQAWSKGSFVRFVRRVCPSLRIETTRGFRIISGGILRPLEYTRRWWQFNRQLGRAVPSLCIELQVVAHKPKPQPLAAQPSRRAA